MNILYLCDEYPPGRHGGIGTAVRALAMEMVKKGHTVVVAGFYFWGYGEKDHFDDNGVKVYRFRRVLASNIFNRLELLPVRALHKLFTITGIFERDIRHSLNGYKLFLESLIKEYKIDIVEMPDYNDYMLYCQKEIFFPKLSVPVIVKLHGSITYFRREANLPVSNAIWQMEHHLLTQATAVSSVSNYTATKTTAYLQYHEPITTLYNGIEIQAIEEVQKISGQVVFTGSLVQKKGIYQLLAAWNIVHMALPDAKLDILGKGLVKKLKKILTKQAAPTVEFFGHVNKTELYKKLSQASVAVFPSFAECFALAPMEAMLCNTAVIYTSRTSGPELIEDGVTGILVDPNEIKEIASKIIYLLTHSEDCAKIAGQGRTQILNKYDIRVIANKNIDFYMSILHKNASTD